jgi:serine/threonine protein kinase
MIAGRRAKVTDFGMSKLAGAAPSMTPLTMCPGTLAYMPPEALREPPRYTKKLDCFSEGVIMIQVCTRLWPEPGPRTQLIQDSRSPTGSMEMPVLERDRRKDHIDLISPDHGLFSIALDCLKYHEDDRPSGIEICQRLAELKESNKYSESTQRELMLKNQIEVREAEYLEEVENKESEFRQKLWQKERAHRKALCQKDSQIKSKNVELIAKAKQIRRLQQQIDDQVQYTAEIEQSKFRLESQVKQLQKCVDQSAQKLHSKMVSHQAGDQRISPILSMHWRNGGRVPVFEMAKGDAVVKGNVAYFMSYNGVLCSYDSTKAIWNEQVVYTTYKCSSLAIIEHFLTTIGGFYGQFISTEKLLVLMNDSWVEQFPPMPTKRYNTAAVTTKEYLIVAGGKSGKSSKTSLSIVEVMDISSKTWSTVASLPHPYSGASATISGDQIYLLGGSDDSREKMTVLACSMAQLLQASPSVWHQIADTLTYCSTCTTINGELVAIGGYNRQGKRMNDVYSYDSTKNSWSTVSKMPTPRYDCLVTVLPTNELMAVGGRESYGAGNKVEIATLNYYTKQY